jgi:hypothetical protein
LFHRRTCCFTVSAIVSSFEGSLLSAACLGSSSKGVSSSALLSLRALFFFFFFLLFVAPLGSGFWADGCLDSPGGKYQF